MHGKYDWEANSSFGMMFYAKERNVSGLSKQKKVRKDDPSRQWRRIRKCIGSGQTGSNHEASE